MRPPAVVIIATLIPPASSFASPLVVASLSKASIIPQTVPSSPIMGARVAKILR